MLEITYFPLLISQGTWTTAIARTTFWLTAADLMAGRQAVKD